MKKLLKNLLPLLAIAILLPATVHADQCVRFEAEDFSRIAGSMELIHDPTAPGDGTAVGVPDKTSPIQSGSMVRYTIRPKTTGDYYFVGNVLAETGADDSFCVTVEDESNNQISPSYPGQCGGKTYWDFWATPGWQNFELRNGWNTWPPSAQPIVYVSLNKGAVYSFNLFLREAGTLFNYGEFCLVDSMDGLDAEAEQAADLPASQ